MPDPAGAGRRRMVTGAPECSPTPVNSSGAAMVCSRWALLLKNISLRTKVDQNVENWAYWQD